MKTCLKASEDTIIRHYIYPLITNFSLSGQIRLIKRFMKRENFLRINKISLLKVSMKRF